MVSGNYGPYSLITDEIIEDIKNNVEISCIHNKQTLHLINELLMMNVDRSKIMLTFDDYFHRAIPKHFKVNGLAKWFNDKYDIRKHGFHGIACANIKSQLRHYIDRESFNAIFVHLGSGCTISLIKDGESVNNTATYTPTSGIMMGHRSGNLDPSIFTHLMTEFKTIKRINQFLNKECGLFGMTNHTSIEHILEDDSEEAKTNLIAFTNQIIKEIIYYFNILPTVDNIIFSGGISEYNPKLIKMIIDGIKLVKVYLNKDFEQKQGVNRISDVSSEIDVYLIYVDEEKEMYDMVNNINENEPY
ncbi:acetate/propionate family kinase [Ureaplasma canigenitalium]|uniref:acetate/propionate family kinase n=1 Tax=Ureaplasma canigenitalium TaxID=42092 RepID=UPI0004E1077F|nr:acetate/propionate family kinase [Ureaplasma canigenitalium]